MKKNSAKKKIFPEVRERPKGHHSKGPHRNRISKGEPDLISQNGRSVYDKLLIKLRFLQVFFARMAESTDSNKEINDLNKKLSRGLSVMLTELSDIYLKDPDIN
ncbi:MAG: hypothetical protein NTZ26_14975 [Candidatus Aminicenantes bacterium]|nr:hypothetical protein [Candidatus Aminicenantes bacterium]